MKTRGRGIFKEQWFSICSAHQGGDGKDCKLCATGHWNNIVVSRMTGFVFKHFPKVWIYFANHRWFNRKQRKFLEETFPNLRMK